MLDTHPRPRARRRPIAAPLALAALLAACGDSGPPPPRPTSIDLFPAQATFDAVGAERSFLASVRDQNGLAMTGEAVDWSSSDPSVVSIDANGRAVAVGDGSAVVRAVAREATGEASVTVAQVPTGLSGLDGNEQEAAAGTTLPTPLRVEVVDRLGAAVVGRTVEFEILAGGGSVDPAATTTDAQGRASTHWTLGPRAGEPQAARASIQGSSVAGVAFTAVGFAGPPAELRARSGGGQAGLVGVALPVPLGVEVLDAVGNPLTAEVTFEVIEGGGTVDPSIVSTGLLGRASSLWTLGPTPGRQRVRASTNGVTHDFIATAATQAGTPATLEIASGDRQEGPAGAALEAPLTVVVRDALGIGVEGVDVAFSPSEGVVAPMISTTGSSGLAATSWTLGATVGPQSVQVTSDALDGVTFVAEALDPGPTCVLAAPDPARFNVQFCFVTSVSDVVADAFQAARARWEALIVGDLPNLAASPDAGTWCLGSSEAPPMQGTTIDDLVIYASVEEIDGEFGVLASAGPCLIRPAGLGSLPTVGIMLFDIVDVDRLAATGHLEEVIVHEMGHVLGIGTLWETFGFLQNKAAPGQPAPWPDTHFNGPLAIAAFDQAGGQLRSAGQKVPVENVGPSGSINGHWRESTFDRELLTPYLDAGGLNPLSIVTVQSLGDLGYQVSNIGADPYTVTHVNGVSGRAGGGDPRAGGAGATGTNDPTGRGIALVGDILRIPLRVVDEAGRVVRILPPGGG